VEKVYKHFYFFGFFYILSFYLTVIVNRKGIKWKRLKYSRAGDGWRAVTKEG